MKRVHGVWLLVAMTGLLAACGPARKSVFPPLVSVQQLQVGADGAWNMQVRIQNNSYTGVKFTAMQLDMQLAGAPAGHIQAAIDLDIPALSVDIANVRIMPSAGATRRLADGGASVPYRLVGTLGGTPGQGGNSRQFKVDSGAEHTLSPTPGLPGTWR